MFRQAIATSSRTVRSGLRTQTPKPVFQNQFQTSPAFRIRAAQPAVARWYSDAKENNDNINNNNEAPKEAEKAEKADDAESALKKQLEAKEKEAADWKVR